MKRKVIVSFLTILISIPLLMDTPLAEGNNVRTWAYGTYSSDFNGALSNYQQTGVLNIPFGSSTVPIPIGKTHAYQEINFQMTNYMDGYISFYFNEMPSTNLCDLYVSNATIQSWNYQTGYLSLAINGVDNFTVTLVNRSTFTSWLNSEVTITWSGISLTAVNAPAYSLHNMDLALAQTNTTLNSILNAVDQTETYLSDIATYAAYIDDINNSLTTTNQTLSTILTRLNNLDSINTNLINMDIPAYSLSIWRMLTQNDPTKLQFNDYGKFVTITDQITFENYVRDTEDYVMIYATGASNIYPVFTESDTTATVVRTVRSYNNYFYVVKISTTVAGNKHFTFNNASVNRYIYPYYYGWADYIPQELMSIAVDQYSDAYTLILNTLYNDLTEVENKINTIEWIDKNAEFQNVKNEIGSVVGTTASDYSNGTYITFKPSLYNQEFLNSIIKIQLKIGNSTDIDLDHVEFYARINNQWIKVNSVIYVQSYRSNANVYIDMSDYSWYPNDWTNTELAVKINTNYHIYSVYQNYIYYLPQSNTNYWNIKTYIDAIKYHQESKSLLQGIIDAIHGINVNNNVTNTQVNNSVTDYNTNIDQIYDIENDFSLDFDGYNQQYNPDFTDVVQNIETTNDLMNGILTDLYNVKFIKYPTMIILAGIVLLALLGV